MFIANEDGNTPAKQKLCQAHGVEYVVLRREPHADLTPRSTTALRTVVQMPYRIDLAGGWLDQPFVSQQHPGPVITISLQPTIEFNELSGMATSTRRAALEMWGLRLPVGEHETLAKMLFCYDNPPGTTEISGSQDSIGIVYPGLAKADYEGAYWPTSITHVCDDQTVQFVEDALHLIPLDPRSSDFDVLADTRIDRTGAQALADAAAGCWAAILARDIGRFGQYFRASFEAQIAMFPHMVTDDIMALIDRYRDLALGWKLSGAGGGGYLIMVAEGAIPNAIRIVARR